MNNEDKKKLEAKIYLMRRRLPWKTSAWTPIGVLTAVSLFALWAFLSLSGVL